MAATFADPILADLIERARAAQAVAEAAQSAVWAYLTRCQGEAERPDALNEAWPAAPDHPSLISPREAAARALRDEDTIRRWAVQYGIGRLYAGRWRISVSRLTRVIEMKNHRCG